MNQINRSFTPIEHADVSYRKIRNSTSKVQDPSLSFTEVLKQVQNNTDTETIRFSKHAANRMRERDLTLSAEQKERLESGVQKASEKGINESLIMIDSLAFIVNIPNRTVITAMDQMESDDSIFTNIDGAVIM